MTHYLEQFFPKPLLEDIVRGECIPIIGSGFSLNANLPTGYKMPLWDDLGKLFADYLPSYNYSNPLDAISAYSHEFSRNKLISKLSDFLHINHLTPGDTHKAFADLPFKTVCTTNFDFLLEASYAICKPIIDESQLSISADENTTLIMKIHGDLNHPTQLVATEEDYDLYLDKNPLMATYISYLLIVKTPLFIGYSIDDPDFRQLFKVVNERLGNSRRPAYTIKINANQHEITKYERRGVKVINIIEPKAVYSKVLTDIFVELKKYWSDNILKSSTFTQNDTKIQLLNDDNAQNRLCFFSIPFKYLPMYKELVFPIVEKYGFIPLTADEVISYGDTVLAKISAMINKADMIICDISDHNNNVINELSMAINDGARKILVVGSPGENNELTKRFGPLKFIDRKNDFKFIDQIDSWIKSFSEEALETFSKEPSRLLSKREYRAAIISAISLLEVEMANVIGTNNIKKMYTHRLSKVLGELEILTHEEVRNLQEWQMIRNELAHTQKTISKEKATQIVDGIVKIIEKIKRIDPNSNQLFKND